jgi:hypothetical protein
MISARRKTMLLPFEKKCVREKARSRAMMA